MTRFKQFTPHEKKVLTKKLEAAPNVEAMLNVLISEFKLDEAKPGLATKSGLVYGLVNTVLPMINPESK